MTKHESIVGTWADPLKDFLNSPEFKTLGKALKQDMDANDRVVLPFHLWQIFEAFHLCPWDKLKVVFLTNNPYIGHETGGLALSAPGVHFGNPPVLQKVWTAVKEDCHNGLKMRHGNTLGKWATQGVLLLNCDLTSVIGKRGAHLKLWEPFIKAVIQALNQKVGVIFCLIGNVAQQYKDLFNPDHEVILIEHPMKAVVENRDWDHHGIFDYLSRYSNFMFDKPINW